MPNLSWPGEARPFLFEKIYKKTIKPIDKVGNILYNIAILTNGEVLYEKDS